MSQYTLKIDIKLIFILFSQKENGEKDNIYNVGEMEQLGIAHQIAKGMVSHVSESRG